MGYDLIDEDTSKPWNKLELAGLKPVNGVWIDSRALATSDSTRLNVIKG